MAETNTETKIEKGASATNIADLILQLQRIVSDLQYLRNYYELCADDDDALVVTQMIRLGRELLGEFEEGHELSEEAEGAPGSEADTQVADALQLAATAEGLQKVGRAFSKSHAAVLHGVIKNLAGVLANSGDEQATKVNKLYMAAGADDGGDGDGADADAAMQDHLANADEAHCHGDNAKCSKAATAANEEHDHTHAHGTLPEHTHKAHTHTSAHEAPATEKVARASEHEKRDYENADEGALIKAAQAQIAQMTALIDQQKTQLTDLTERLQKIEAQPMPGGPVSRVGPAPIKKVEDPSAKKQELEYLRRMAATEPNPGLRMNYQAQLREAEKQAA